MRRALGSVIGSAAALAVVAAGVTAGTAEAVGPVRIGPHQPFTGLVNGRFADATVDVVCPGPSRVGRALPGQTLAVEPALAPTQHVGNTGANGRRIVAVIGPTAAASDSVVFTRYGAPQAFPTTIPVPCSGTSVIPFIPQPTGPGARASTVTVTWVDLAVVSTSATVTPTPPHITAHPDTVMVGRRTRLVGSGFAPDSTLRIEECSQTSWIVPQNPCDAANAISVQTDAAGRFHSPFTVLTCGPVPTPGFAQTCYVGNPRPFGIDQIRLVGAAPVTVTGP